MCCGCVVRDEGERGGFLKPTERLTLPPPLPFLSLQRDGCPKIINLGVARIDAFYKRKAEGGRRAG